MSVLVSLKKLLRFLMIIAFVSGFNGCIFSPQEKTADTIEITPATSGQLVVSSFGEQDSLTGTLLTAANSISDMSLQSQFSISSASSLGKRGLSKSKDNSTATTADLSDTASGIALLYCYTKELLCDSYDTIVVKWDEFAKDSIQNNENIISVSGAKIYALKTERYSVTDLDGDGIVSGQAKYNGKARFTYSSLQAGTLEKLVMDVSAGPDQNFSTDADNQILAMSWVQIAGSDTTSYATFADADNDGMLIDKSKATPLLVDVVLFQKNPPLKPFVQSTTLSMRIQTNGIDSNDKIIRLSGEEHRMSGRIVTLTVTDSSGNPDIAANHIAIATFASDPATDLGAIDTVKFVFNVAAGLQDQKDQLLYGLHLKKDKQIGIVRDRTFDFTTADPVKSGEKPTSGHIVMSVTYSNDKTASLVADFSPTGFSGTWTGPDGNTVNVTWDNNGEVVSSK